MACEYILIGFLIILIILILVPKCKNESFVVPVNANGTGTKVLDDSYVYPDCKTNSTCITSDNKSKTYITYKASDNRCIKSDIQVPSSELDNWVSYSNINTNFKSCSTGTNTMMSYVSGKYIKILRDDSIPIKLKYLAAYDITGKLVTNSSNIVYIKPYVGQYLVPNQDNINFQTGSPNPYIIIDLKYVSNISYIVIRHNNDADASSLNGSYIAILDEISGTEIINYISKITDSKIERTIYLHSYILQPNPANSNILYDSVTWPCTGCVDVNNNLYKKYMYSNTNNCLKVKDYNTNVSWLANAFATPMTITQTNLDKYFMSCSNTINTMPEIITYLLLIQFDSSDLTTLFKDTIGTKPVTSIGDSVKCWKMTTNCVGAGTSATIVAGSPVLSYFTLNTKAVNFMQDGYYNFQYNLSTVMNATLIIVMSYTGKYSGHPWNTVDNAGWINYENNVYETFYTNSSSYNRTNYSYILPSGVPFIYIVSANKTANTTKCYTYISNKLTNIATLTYGNNNSLSSNNKGLSSYSGYNNFRLAELLVYNYTMTEQQITTKVTELQTKWNTTAFNILYNWDASISSTVVDGSNNPVLMNGNVSKWLDSNFTGVYFNNNNISLAKLESEVRNGITYRYVRNLRQPGGYLLTSNPIIKTGRTFFFVFRQNVGDQSYVHLFMKDSNNKVRSWHGPSNRGVVNDIPNGDNEVGDYSIRIWAFKFTNVSNTRCLFPSLSNPKIGTFVDMSFGVSETASVLYVGQIEDGYPSSICIYEMILVDSLMSDSAMMTYYNSLIVKWGI